MPLASLEIATATRPHPGMTVCGDAALLSATRRGALVAVVDGLGHGDGAALAASMAIDTLQHGIDHPVDQLLVLCHRALQRTQGCVMAVATIASATPELVWAGIGNVEAAVWGPFGLVRARLGSRPGIVGYRVEPARPESVVYGTGDLLIVATDGIRHSGLDGVTSGEPVATIATTILERGARDDDDALVLVARRRTEAAGAASGTEEVGG